MNWVFFYVARKKSMITPCCGGIGRRLRWRLSFLGRQPDPVGTLPTESRWLLLRLKLSGPFMALGSPELVYAIADPRGQSLNSIFLKIKLD